MPYVVIEDFRLGLDRRKSILTAAAGSLWVLRNAQITAGGEISKRKAFVADKVLPAGTVGMAILSDAIYVFGHGTTPGGLPSGVTYQRLQHPSGQALTKILDYDAFDGKLYVAAQFANGDVFHFYDGSRVVDWFDGSARAAFAVQGGPQAGGVAPTSTFNISAGSASAGAAATTSFQITGGSAGVGNQVTSITVGGVDILGTPVLWTTDNATTAAAVATQINTYNSSPEFTASAVGNTITLTGPVGTTAHNGVTPVVTVGGTVTASAPAALSGGALPNQITSITVNGTDILGAAVLWATSNNATASAVAAQINSYSSTPNFSASANGATVTLTGPIGASLNSVVPVVTTNNVTATTPTALSGGVNTATVSSITVSGVQILNSTISWGTSDDATATAIANQINSYNSTPEYIASAAGNTVTIVANTPGADANGRSFAVTSSGDLVIAPDTGTLSGGVDGSVSPPGTVVLTHKSKVYSVSGKTLHFSGTGVPTAWQPNGAAGAGFINMNIQDGEAENLVALETYYDKIAVFGRRSVQIWNVSQDPAQNTQYQTLKNLGSRAARATRQYGNADVFVLSDSGLRSLRARDSSNVAAVNDVGTPIDALITADINTLGDAVADAVSAVEPIDGRFLLALGSKIYVFSFFPASKIAAWSVWEPGFTIEALDVQGDQILARAGNTIYRYGGEDNTEYGNDYEVEAVLPLLDAKSPATIKQFSSVDIGCVGQWTLEMGVVPEDPEVRDIIGTITQTTFGLNRIPVSLNGTHASLRLTHQGAGEAVLSTLLLHYTGGETG